MKSPLKFLLGTITLFLFVTFALAAEEEEEPFIEISFEVFGPAEASVIYDSKARIDKPISLFNTQFLITNELNMKKVKMFVDGKEQKEAGTELTFSKPGNHTIKYIIPEPIKDMRSMFYQKSFINTIRFGNIDVSKVETMTDAFSGCFNLQEINGLENLDFSNVKYASAVFNHCDSLEKINIGNIVNKNLRDFSFFFYQCSNLEEIEWTSVDSSSLQMINQAFSMCPKLKKVDLSEWDFTETYSFNEIFFVYDFMEHNTEVIFKDKAQYEKVLKGFDQLDEVVKKIKILEE